MGRDLTGIPPGNGSIASGRMTLFRIAEMQLIACETADGVSQWRGNVSACGVLRVVRGKLKPWGADFLDVHGLP